MSVKHDMEALLWSNGCDLETAKFASRMLQQHGFALVRTEYLDSIGTPFASCHSHEQACERLRRINSATYSGVPSKQVEAALSTPPDAEQADTVKFTDEQWQEIIAKSIDPTHPVWGFAATPPDAEQARLRERELLDRCWRLNTRAEEAEARLAQQAERATAVTHLCGGCEIGSYEGQVILPAPAWLAHKWPNGIGIDVCLALEIQGLWRADIQTSGHCCGHGKLPGYISVWPEFIDQMKAAGYRVQQHPDDPSREDHFAPKSALAEPQQAVTEDALARVTGVLDSYEERFGNGEITTAWERGIRDTCANIRMAIAGTHDEAALRTSSTGGKG